MLPVARSSTASVSAVVDSRQLPSMSNWVGTSGNDGVAGSGSARVVVPAGG
jgi:hypothetical protein